MWFNSISQLINQPRSDTFRIKPAQRDVIRAQKVHPEYRPPSPGFREEVEELISLLFSFECCLGDRDVALSSAVDAVDEEYGGSGDFGDADARGVECLGEGEV